MLGGSGIGEVAVTLNLNPSVIDTMHAGVTSLSCDANKIRSLIPDRRNSCQKYAGKADNITTDASLR